MYPKHLEEFMVELGKAMEEELPGGVATFTIQPWQKELKRVDLDLAWPVDGDEQTLHQHTYIHQNAAPQ
jgi:hypothetical protein